LITILSLLLSACELIDNGNGNQDSNKEKRNDKDKDNGNGNNNKGNSTSPGKITICHKTGSAKNPYVEITVSNTSTMDGHSTHEGDLIPAPEGGCPSEVIKDDVPPK
jgi:hypothetical protein